MTQDDIIRMAREAGLIRVGDGWTEPSRWGVTEIKRFAQLVADHERDACAYRAGIALLGVDRGLSNRVNQSIRARGNNG